MAYRMLVAMMVVSVVSGVALIVTVSLQTSKAESFSAAMGGADSSQFRKGSRDELLARLTKYLAIIWIASAAVCAVLWYHVN